MQTMDTTPLSAPPKDKVGTINVSQFYSEMVQLIISFGRDKIVSPQKCQSNNEKKIISSTTFWRWDEQLLMELPQRNLIESVFSKIFNSRNIGVWKNNLTGELEKYVTITYPSTFTVIDKNSLENPSIYDSYIIASLSCKNGSGKNELIKNLCILHYLSNEKEADQPLSEEKVDGLILLYKDSVLEQIEYFITNGLIKETGKRYFATQENIHIPNLKHATNLKKLEALKIKSIGLSNPHNMFLGFNFSLSQKDMYEFMVELKKMTSKFSKKLEIKESSEFNSEHIRFTINTWNLNFSEHITCQDNKMELLQ